MAPLLTAFLADARGRPFAWGEWDCLMVLAAWITAQRGVDPAAAWRGRYRTERGAARIIARAGGMVAHMDACLVPFGIDRTAEPRAGDIAVVIGSDGQTRGAILSATLAVSVGPNGLTCEARARVRLLAAWRV